MKRTLLAALRKKQGMSQHELARRVKCHQTTISLTERGYEIPRTSLLQRIADVVGFEGDLLDLLDEAPELPYLRRVTSREPS